MVPQWVRGRVESMKRGRTRPQTRAALPVKPRARHVLPPMGRAATCEMSVFLHEHRGKAGQAIFAKSQMRPITDTVAHLIEGGLGMNQEAHIHCPLCDWEPKAESRWVCAPGEPGSGCRTVWNTFWTAGCCPGCRHFWSKTKCLSCKRSSPTRPGITSLRPSPVGKMPRRRKNQRRLTGDAQRRRK